MDSKGPESTLSRPLRRSTRQSSSKVLNFEPTPRGPLKRTKRALENQTPVAAVNGSRDVEDGSEEEEEESPSKKSRLEAGGEHGGDGDGNEMDVQEDLETNEDQEMDIGQDSSQDSSQDSFHDTHQPKLSRGALGDVNLSPHVMLGERCQPNHVVKEVKRVKPSTKEPVVFIKSATRIRLPAARYDLPNLKETKIDEYKRTMEDKAKSTVFATVNHHIPRVYSTSEEFHSMRQRVNNIPKQEEIFQQKKQAVKKPAIPKSSSPHSSRGCMWYFWRLVLLVLLGSSALLVHRIIPVLQRTAGGAGRQSRAVNPENFTDHLALLKTQFPSQRPELWKMTEIHLEKHLKTAQPTEPVSLIFTAGLRAKKTMHCLAQGLASSFSSALNASVLHIDGASKASQDSDEVKLDIDTQLQSAFEGDKPVAVIHQFEELPPGSTLIFYRYCDHQNAAYKRVFLLFTVLMPIDEVKGEQSLKEVEEMVLDYVKEKLVDSGDQTAFNEMDTDKFGGLWSRISHLILPVVSEKEVEQNGC
uniref:torsin-1A-interacting protein 2 isoform X2 n=1 Tax=Scatophagus argus TaxID=75038 RepID=UPI001ED80D1A|nr:torsin-1A-interacting protein 2 isoform X2 [Scatophagus argus]